MPLKTGMRKVRETIPPGLGKKKQEIMLSFLDFSYPLLHEKFSLSTVILLSLLRLFKPLFLLKFLYSILSV